eukprot:1317613-Pyramimonas_sp.AAC.1
MERVWGEGEPQGWAACALAAAQHVIPSAGHHLPSAWRLKAAWDKLELPERVPPLTQAATLADAGATCDAGRP